MEKLTQIKRAKRGDKQAFQELMEEEKSKLYKLAYIYVRNEDEALEIFQETVYKALMAIADLKQEQYFSTWLTRILINTALDYLRKKQCVVPMNEEIFDSLASARNGVQPEDQLDLLDALGKLDEKYKTVLFLRFYEDYTVKQIASLLNHPEGTVKTNIHRALQLLRGKLKESDGDDKRATFI
ncbi:sigma-70 family RNA polymerase sigma factor [Alkalihalobacillus oceani]|uniref:sigma-70 family RNA polymerase sigma factor n=1 Tax=Halalkalibacter oceani TaxID=1653776 RepID=UPI002041B301|nr:sigma-70 family RNA polymerase sigma factor [Halalkalibacter oceani]MCM3760868.1 sigma-70 family RNA polymerase sigma factor [Halalkalibacter oceani]